MPICVAGEESDQSRALKGSGLHHLAPVPTAARACSVEYMPFAQDCGGVAVDNCLAHYKSKVTTFSVYFQEHFYRNTEDVVTMLSESASAMKFLMDSCTWKCTWKCTSQLLWLQFSFCIPWIPRTEPHVSRLLQYRCMV
jgi:hypothetical protein